MGGNSKNTRIFRIQLYVSLDSYPELFDVLKDAGRYYRGRKLLKLAMDGLSVRNGMVVLSGGSSRESTAAATASTPPTKAKAKAIERKQEDVSSSAPHYAIPDSASELVGNMLDEMGLGMGMT